MAAEKRGEATPCPLCKYDFPERYPPEIMPENELAIEIITLTPHEPMAGTIDFRVLWDIMKAYPELNGEEMIEIHKKVLICNQIEQENKDG
jgi:hypothetical protein